MRRYILLVTIACLAAAGPLAASDQDTETLARARQLQLEFRQGNPRVVDSLVESLETAVARQPTNSDLWEALGNAYMSKQGALYQSQADQRTLIAAGERAREAYARALTMDKKNALLLVSHGMAGMGLATIKRDAAGLKAAIEEMDAAVRQAPNSTPVRLTRGFTTIHLPVAIRDTADVVEDLNFIMETSPGGRPEDVLHVLLGDVYAEVGDLDQARREYQLVTGASQFAAEQSRLRLEELKKGGVSPASIGLVRAGTGYRCVMCHAPGTDN